MKSITIHDLDDSLDALIREKAKEEGFSLSSTVKMLLHKAFSLEPDGSKDTRTEFTEFSGVWSKADAAEFARNMKDLRKVDPRDRQ